MNIKRRFIIFLARTVCVLLLLGLPGALNRSLRGRGCLGREEEWVEAWVGMRQKEDVVVNQCINQVGGRQRKKKSQNTSGLSGGYLMMSVPLSLIHI